MVFLPNYYGSNYYGNDNEADTISALIIFLSASMDETTADGERSATICPTRM